MRQLGRYGKQSHISYTCKKKGYQSPECCSLKTQEHSRYVSVKTPITPLGLELGIASRTSVIMEGGFSRKITSQGSLSATEEVVANFGLWIGSVSKRAKREVRSPGVRSARERGPLQNVVERGKPRR